MCVPTFLPVRYYSKAISAGKDMIVRKCNLYFKQKIKFVDELTKLRKPGAQVHFQPTETAQQGFSKCFCSLSHITPASAPDTCPSPWVDLTQALDNCRSSAIVQNDK